MYVCTHMNTGLQLGNCSGNDVRCSKRCPNIIDTCSRQPDPAVQSPRSLRNNHTALLCDHTHHQGKYDTSSVVRQINDVPGATTAHAATTRRRRRSNNASHLSAGVVELDNLQRRPAKVFRATVFTARAAAAPAVPVPALAVGWRCLARPARDSVARAARRRRGQQLRTALARDR